MSSSSVRSDRTQPRRRRAASARAVSRSSGSAYTSRSDPGSVELVGDAGDVLDDTIVQVAGDPPPLRVGGPNGEIEQRRRRCSALQPTRQGDRQWHLHEFENEQRADGERREAPPGFQLALTTSS